jgi:hypothetical protein
MANRSIRVVRAGAIGGWNWVVEMVMEGMEVSSGSVCDRAQEIAFVKAMTPPQY